MEDDGAATLREPDGGEAALADPVAAGRLALARGAFAEARGLFEAAAREAAGAPALEGLSWAAWWLADDAAMFDLREQAYLAYRAEGDVRGAARMATWLGTDHVDFRGEAAVAQGWFGRARRLLEDLAPCEEHGWLLVHEAEKRLFANDTDTARDLGVRAAEIGRAERAVDLEMMGLATEGLALVTVGELDAGMSRLDQAVAAAIGGEFAEKWAMVWCCCYMLNACERVRDYDRAGQWCRRIEGLTAQARVRMLNLACRAYHGGVHIHRGAWTEAERTLVDAAAQLAAIRPPMVSEATVRLGELRRRQGRLDEAAAIFAGLEGHGLALLGSAEICLDRDDPARARDQAAQYLRDIPSHIGTLRAGGLELLVRAHLALGEPDTARTAADELAAIGDRVGTDSLRATARVAVGSVAAATGDAGLARVAFEDATRLFHRCEAPFEAGRARIELARVLAGLDRPRHALRELRAAAATLRRIGAAREADRADRLAEDLEPARVPALSRRECEVLRLVADGYGDRAIAATLVLSEHTVHRHVANILVKLGCPSRSAAVAEALRTGVL